MKKLTILAIIFTLIFLNLNNVQSLTANEDELNILIINSTDTLMNDADAREFEILLSHFTENVQVRHISDMVDKKLNEFTHVFYYGQYEEQISKKIIKKIDSFPKDVIFIGKNSEQFSTYSSIEVKDAIFINDISAKFQPEPYSLRSPMKMLHVRSQEELSILLYSQRENKNIPLLLKVTDNRYYLATSSDGRIQSNELLQYFTEALHNILPHNHQHEHDTYILIENIHPMSDPEGLKEIGQYLNDKGIPFILSVTPIFITPKKNEWVPFSKKNDVLKVLKSLQESGGTIIAHGYTNHLWGDLNKPEFWDQSRDQFIIDWNEDDTLPLLKRENFANNRLFKEYLTPYKEIEAEYIHHQLESSIQELDELGLYPLAFQVPQNKMSQQGYQIVSEYFSTLMGYVQLSDEFSHVMSRVTVKSIKHDQNNLFIYPSTINHVDFSSLTSKNDIERKISEATIVRDSVIGSSYPVYLGVEDLKGLINEMEVIKNIKWLNLKETKQQVKTEQLMIKTTESGELIINDQRSNFEVFVDSRRGKLIENILWIIIGTVFIFIVAFLIITLYLRINLKKRLFEEKKSIG